MKPLSSWWEDEMKEGREVKALTVVLRGNGCAFARTGPCTMCGYNNETPQEVVKSEDYIDQMMSLSDELKGCEYVKIFTSGSFTDPSEVPADANERILRMIGEMAPSSRVLVESRPEFITEEVLDRMLSAHHDIEVAIGLETTDDDVRSELIGKGFKISEFCRGADLLVSKGIHLKVYLILKPPFLSEAGSIKDVVSSIEWTSNRYPGSTVSINPVNVQRGTNVEILYEAGEYRPPWLWSVIEVLKQGKSITGDRLRIISHPTGGGKRRGAHNCGKCDGPLLDAIRRFDITNDYRDLPPGKGCCFDEWKQSLAGLD